MSTLLRDAVAGATPASRTRLFAGQEPSVYRWGGSFHMYYNLPGSGVLHRTCPETKDPTVATNWSAASATVVPGLSHQSVYEEGDNLWMYGVDVATENLKVATATKATPETWTVVSTPVMTAPIGNQPTSHTGNSYLVKRGPSDYVMFIEANWQGTYEGATIGLWQTWVATGTSPLGPFTKVGTEPLHSLRPLGLGMADLEARGAHGRDRRRSIGVLVAARQDRRRQVHQPVLILIDHAAIFLIGEEILAVDGDRASQAFRRLHQHRLCGLGLLCADDDRAARLDNARLFRRNQLDTIAEIGLMVERHRHDQRDGRVGNDVGRVETTAEAHLDDCRIGRLLGKQDEGDRGKDFEDGDRLAAIGLGDARNGFRQQRIVDELASALGA